MSKFDSLDYWHRSRKKSFHDGSTLTTEVEKKLAEAANKKVKVEIIYSGGSEPPSRRIIEPNKLYERLGNNYVESYCHLRDEYRTFKIDRIESIQVLNSPQEKDYSPTPTHSATYQSTPKAGSSGIPGWIWIVGFFLLLYFCSKFR